MDENLLANIDQELLIKNLDDLNSNQSVSFPIQDLSSYGDEVANHLEQIAVGAIKQYATGAAKNQKFSTVLKDSTLSHFGIQVKPQKGAAKNAKNLKNVKSVPTAQFIAIAAIMAVISANLKEIIAVSNLEISTNIFWKTFSRSYSTTISFKISTNIFRSTIEITNL